MNDNDGIEALHLTDRPHWTLSREGFQTVGQLRAYIAENGARSLLQFRNFGMVSLGEVLEKLKQH